MAVESEWWTGKRRKMDVGGVIVLLLLLLLLVVVVRGAGEAASVLTGSWKWVGKTRRS
jgi:Na+-transporting methylmalonyl-CoA/oxaloacetate decarboxylase gamma subunit